MILYEEGKEYWVVVRRYHIHKSNPAMRGVVLRELREMLSRTKSEAVEKKIKGFIAKHQPPPKPFWPGGGMVA